jgi:hypothetical protein
MEIYAAENHRSISKFSSNVQPLTGASGLSYKDAGGIRMPGWVWIFALLIGALFTKACKNTRNWLNRTMDPLGQRRFWGNGVNILSSEWET